jgi:serine/threonine protein kinase
MKAILIKDSRYKEDAEKEINVLEKLDHHNVIKYIDKFITIDNQYICIIMEYAESMTHALIIL